MNFRLRQLALLTLLHPGFLLAESSGIVGTLAPTQSSYIDAEPVELLLTILNNGTQDARILADYPSFGGRNHAGIRISRSQDGKSRAPATLAPSPPIQRIVSTPIITVGPGEKWSSKVYLQSYNHDLRVGANSFAYQIDICVLKAGPGCDAVTGAGTLQVIVLEDGHSLLATSWGATRRA